MKNLILILYCFATAVMPLPVEPQILFQSSFEGNNPWAGFDNGQHCCTWSVQQATNIFHDGTKSFRAEVRSTDPAVSAGWRAELVPSYSGGDGGNMWYGFSIYFVTPANGQFWTGSYGGHIIQAHPNNSGGSLSWGLWGSDGIWDFVTNPEGDETAVHHANPVGGGPQMKITANVWHNVVIHVDRNSGTTQFWLNGILHTNIVINWSSGPSYYLKFGMNRWGNCSGGRPCDTWVIYYDNLKIGRNVTYNDVVPGTGIVTPVSLSSFVYNRQLDCLQWSTVSEINNDHWEVQESLDGITWQTIGTVKTKAPDGNSSEQLNYNYSL